MSSFSWPPQNSFGSVTLNGSTSGALTITVPAVVTSYTLVMPGAQGAAGTTLENDGSGNLSWAIAGGITIGTYDSQAGVANGLQLIGDVLYAQSATATVPGMLSIGVQTIAGAKTFTGAISASNLSGTNTGNVTLAAVGAVPNANGASLSGQALTLQPANTSFPGVLTAADWNTFNSKQATITIGSLDAQAANANGLALVANVLSTQSADATHPGMVNTGSQTFLGNKQFQNTTPIVSLRATGGAGNQQQINFLNTAASGRFNWAIGNQVVNSNNFEIIPSTATDGSTFTTPVFKVSNTGDAVITGTIAASNLSGTNTGDVTLAAVGSAPSANGATLSGQVLILQPADATHPGLVTISSQTIAGAKTFSDGIVATVTGHASLDLAAASNLSDVGTPATAFNNISGLTTLGDLIYGGASGVRSRLAGNITTTKKFLTQTGDGVNSIAPGWNTIVAADVPSLAASIITSGTLATARGGTNSDSSASTGIAHVSSGSWTYSAVDLSSADASGILAAARFPALTGDITTSSGSLATTAAATQANIATLSKSTGVAIHGTNTNNNASAGDYGEYLEAAQASFISMTAASNAYQDGGSLILTAGDWDISYHVVFQSQAALGLSFALIAITTTTGNSGTGVDPSTGAEVDLTTALGSGLTVSLAIPRIRASINSTTTYYGKLNTAWSTTAPKWGGRLSARRMR